jgi:hypothetical protein
MPGGEVRCASSGLLFIAGAFRSTFNSRNFSLSAETAIVTQSQYTFEFPYEPSPVPPCELVMLHTMRKDHDDTHVICSTSVDAYHYSKTNGKRRGQVR